MKKIAVWALMATFLAPFIVAPNIIAPYVGGKVLFLRGIIFFVFFLVTCILLFTKEKERIYLSIKEMVKDPIFLALSLNVFFLIFSTIFAFDKSVAFFGQPERYEGFITLFSIYLFFISFRLLFSKKDWNIFFILTSLSAVTLFIIEVVQALGGAVRPEALSGNPDFLAIQYLFSIFAGLYVFQIGKSLNKKWYMILGVAASVFSVLGILLSKTRGPLVGLGVAIVICAIIAAIIGKEKIIFCKFSLRKIGTYVCTLILFFSVILGVTYNSSFWKNIPGVNRIVETKVDDGSMQARLIHISTSVKIFTSEKSLTRVLFGWGWDNYIFAWSKYYNPKVFYYDPAIADRAHDKIMDLLVMSGILGLFSYISLWFFVLKKIFKMMKESEITIPILFIFFFVAYIVSLLFIFDTPLTLLTFYSLLAFLNCLTHERKV